MSFAAGFCVHAGFRWQKASDASSEHAQLESRSQLAVVLISGPSCRAATPQEIRVAFDSLMAAVASRYGRPSVEIKAIGVSVDGDVASGVRYLERVATFDEVAVGGGWHNTAVRQFATLGLAGPLTIPQVVIVSRQRDGTWGSGLGPDSLVARLVGIGEIHLWARRFSK